MMDIQLKDYQLDCLEKVTSKISDGAKHLSVVMTAGFGQKTTSLFLANRLYSEEQTMIAMVFKYKAALMQTKSDAEKIGIDSVEFFSVNEFLSNETDYQYVILHDLSTYERKQIQEYIESKDSITISFSAPGQEVVGENVNPAMNQRLMAYMERLSPVVCVYVTNEVLDIRDAKYAGKLKAYM
ncbi:MAG: DEAD/DEAH box helicase family protein [Lachnospiraceae bacterium]|nr:DEAD/DEAH box helicase family protein [Lachnospiraceae bacterium]